MGGVLGTNQIDDLDWATRVTLWTKSGSQKIRRGTRTRETRPLVLCGHGISLRIDAGSLLINNGFTHYPQAREIYRLFRGDLSLLPESSFWMAAGPYHSTCCRGLRNRRCRSSALTGKAMFRRSSVTPDTPQIRIVLLGRLKHVPTRPAHGLLHRSDQPQDRSIDPNP